MSRLLIVAFSPTDASSLTGFADQLGLPFDVLLLSGNAPQSLGAGRVLQAALDSIPPADGLTSGMVPFCSGYSHIASVSSMTSKDVMARLAGLLGGAMVTDVIGVESASVFHRPVLAGSVIATVEVLQTPVIVTVRPASFPTVSGSDSSSEALTMSVDSRVSVLAKSSKGGARPELSQAKVIVSGGRPLRDAESFERVIGGLADALGGAVGATRAAVDSGIAGNELQIGQTGKIVAPDLYIAAGISGSTQHMAGIKDSKLIVAINKDPDAPIFQVADLGLVADLFDVVPALQAKLGQ